MLVVIVSIDLVRYNNFYLWLLWNLRIFILVFYFKVGIMINVKGNYIFEIVLSD